MNAEFTIFGSLHSHFLVDIIAVSYTLGLNIRKHIHPQGFHIRRF